VASNVAVLAVSLVEWAQLLKDVVPECEAVVRSFAANDLMVVRDEAPALIRAQPTYLAVLNDLVREERSDGKGLVYIGDRIVGRRLSKDVIAISIPWSLEEVNEAMTRRGWPTIEGTHVQLMRQLRDEGVLCDAEGRVIPKEAEVASKPVWFESKQSRSFLIRSETLLLA
jgi:hypothetical protein